MSLNEDTGANGNTVIELNVNKVLLWRAGQQLTAQQQQWAFILQELNMWQFLIMFRNPARIAPYISTQCATSAVPYPLAAFLLAFCLTRA